MASAGFLIYSGIMPLIKTYLSILFGYILARKGLFPPAASRGASQVTMNVALPALIFANIVPAFTPANVSAIGPLLLSAFVYVAIGFLLGFIIRELCYVPRNFYQGLVVLTAMSNWGNLPTAVVLTVTQEPPFDPTTDPALGVSFVAIFIVAYNLVFWMLGVAHSLSWDYLPSIPQGEAAECRVSWKEKPIGGWIARVFFGHGTTGTLPSSTTSISSTQIGKQKEKADDDLRRRPSKDISEIHPTSAFDEAHPDPDALLAKKPSIVSITSFRSRQPSAPPLPTFRTQATTAHPFTTSMDPPSSPVSSAEPEISAGHPDHLSASFSPPQPRKLKFFSPFFTRIFRPLSALITPINLSLFVSLPIALIQPLKALFVDISSTGGPAWKGPDGRPPLAFLIDTASFVGGITVPMALILLGTSFARLSIPRPVSRLAIPAMLAVALAKMFVLPVIGIFLVQAMVRAGLIPKENKAERFVAMFLSGTPAAVNQLIVTQLYAPEGNVDTLSAFLLVQYVLMFFSSAAITAVSLSLL